MIIVLLHHITFSGMNSAFQGGSSSGGGSNDPPSWLLECEDDAASANSNNSSNSNSNGVSPGNNSKVSVKGSSRQSFSPNSESGSKGVRSTKTSNNSNSSSQRVQEEPLAELIDCYCCHVDPAILILQLFHATCIFLAIASTISNFYEVTHKVGVGPIDLRDKMIRGFGILLSILACLVECGFELFSKYLALFEFWTCRALLFFLIGLVTMQIDRPLSKFQNISGLGDISLASLYLIMVLFCVRSISERRIARKRRGYLEIDSNDV